MYGVPPDLDLSDYQDAACIQVAVGEFQIQFHFQPAATVYVEGRWELRDGQGQLIDQSVENHKRNSYQIHRILGQTVVASFVSAPASFGLRFANDYVLEVFDDSQEYETSQLSPSGVII